eukprot:GEMP01073525.1.p1 GENE.GEMP01073525.1~~GEMP01073525.1.p1  ORF type:complete len:232 (+),score=48.85 GEMP01073525.1:427-1122(+)
MVESIPPWAQKSFEYSSIACVPAEMLSPSSRPRTLPPAPLEGPVGLPGQDVAREKSSVLQDKPNQADIPPMSSPIPMGRDAPRIAPIAGGPMEATRQLEPQAWNRVLAQREEGYRETEIQGGAPPADTNIRPEMTHGPYTFNTMSLPKRTPSPPQQPRYFDYTRGQFVESSTSLQPKQSIPTPPPSPSSPSVDGRPTLQRKQGTHPAQSTRPPHSTQPIEPTQPRVGPFEV